MKQILINILQTLETQTNFLGQLAADVAALKMALFELDARAQSLFEKQAAITHGRIQQELDSRRQAFEMLRQLISRLPTQKPN